MSFSNAPCPEGSIWGPVQSAEQLLPGIWHITTASHGGIILSDERQAAMPAALRAAGVSYEEDVDWARVYVAFEAEFRGARNPCIDIEMQLAHDTVRSYYPKEYAAFTGVPVEPRDSHLLRSIAAHNAAIGEYVVVAAWGDWADWVPAGKVGLAARKLTGVNHLGFGIFDEASDMRAFAEATRYESRGSVTTLASLDAVPCDGTNHASGWNS